MTEKAFGGMLDFLQSQFNISDQKGVAKILGLKQPQISQYSIKAPRGIQWWRKITRRIYERGYKDGQLQNSSDYMKAILETFGEIPQHRLATALNVSQPTISNWLSGASTPSLKGIQRILAVHVSHLAEPIVEFYEILPARSGKSWKMNKDKTKNERIRKKLEGRCGIYTFYDSAGRVTYLGKTEKCLWREPTQRLKGVVNRPFYKPVKSMKQLQGDVARYVSAYEIRVKEAIHNLEVLMLRAFPNDLANTNIGHFRK